MDTKKSSTTTESASADAASFDLDPPVGRCVRPLRTPSVNSRRRSRSSLRSESNTRVPSPCATREVPGENCALHRFVVWAAVKRNKSVRMAPSERLSCPLVLCGERFDDHETMLRHLTKCQHLKTGEYLCYDCMKIERFNDRKCRCCLGQPTKRRRILNMAKNFFSNIGNRPRKGAPQPDFRDDGSMPPPSYDSLVIDLEEREQRQREQQQHQQQQHERQQQEQRPQPQPQPQPRLELNSREIHELDSRQMMPTAELDPINYDTQIADIPMASDRHNAIPGDIACSQLDVPSNRGAPLTQRLVKDTSMPPPTLSPSTPGGVRPSLALDTHVDRYRNVPQRKHLSPSSSLRSTRSSQNISPITPWSADSVVSRAWTMNSSIDTTMTSPITPCSPSDAPPVLQPEEILATAKAATTCPDDDCNYTIHNVSELPGDDLLSIPRGLSDPLLFSFDLEDNYSWIPSVNTEISLGTSVNMMFADPSSKPTSMPSGFLDPSDRGPDTKTLVRDAWDALQEHVSSSLSKLSHIEGNSLVQRLRTQSPKAVALSGLSSLRNVLQGGDVADPFDYICFVHLIYAFSLVIHEDELEARCNMLYQQAFAHRRFIDPAYFEDYTQIVTTIWQPTSNEQSLTQTRGIYLSGSANRKGKDREYHADPGATAGLDPLMVVGQNFLDDLENSVVSSGPQNPIEILTSELWSTHVMEYHPEPVHGSAFQVTADFIVNVLISKFQYPQSISPKLREIGQKVHAGYITTVRKLELAILQAGKNTLESSVLFDEFIPQVRRLCDQIYSEPGFHSRARYQTLGACLVENLIQTLASEPQNTNDESIAFLPDQYNDFLDHLHETFEDPGGLGDEFIANLGTGVPQQNQPELGSAQTFEPPAEPITLQADIRSASVQRSTTASHVGTPDEPFVASPSIPRSTAVPTPPKAPTPVQAEASPKPTSSTGQKLEANDACEICGYRPKGDPQWFKGSMAKHKKMQHSAGPPTIYKCPYPGCTSQYKNRQDNLRQHQIEKNHFVGDEADRRPTKRKKTSPS
ncbi:hypothetical protein GGR54DRAFT_630594 [Hypoxylon sp. NC1633]|nr:hypothetical protein GGR54DRAFT_630594 [Hypoxylon sp. NC1633]